MSLDNKKESYIFSCVAEFVQHLDELSELPVTYFAHLIRNFLPCLLRATPIPTTIDDALNMSWADVLRVSCFGFVSGSLIHKLTNSLRHKNEIKQQKLAMDDRSSEFELSNKIAVDINDLTSGTKFCRCLASKQFPYCDGSHLKLKSKKQIFPLTITNRADELEMLAPSELLYEKQFKTSNNSSKASPRNLLCRDQTKGESSFNRKNFSVKRKREVDKSCMMGESFNFPAKTEVHFVGDSEDALQLRSKSYNSCTTYELQQRLAKPNEKGEQLPSHLLVESKNKIGDNPLLVLSHDGCQLSTEANFNSELESDPEPEFEYVESSGSSSF